MSLDKIFVIGGFTLLALVIIFDKEACSETPEMMLQINSYDPPPYGRRVFTCRDWPELGERVCHPWTVVQYGEERETHYRGLRRFKGKIFIGNNEARID